MANLEIKTTWDLSPLLAGDNDPKLSDYRAEVTSATKAFVDAWKTRDDYLKDPVILAQAMQEFEALEAKPDGGRDYYYFGLRTSIDSIDTNLKAQESKSVEFIQNISNELQFFWLRVGAIEPSLQQNFLSYADLQPYHHWLERQFAAAKHRLSEPEEKIMSLKSTPASSLWVQMTSDLLSQDEREAIDESGATITATEERLLTLMTSRDKKVRDVAARAFNELLVDHVSVATSEINAILTNKKIDDQLRTYDRPDEARHVSDDIDTEVVDALIEAVSSRYDISHRYYELRAKLVGLPKLAYYEKSIDFGDENTTYAFPEAANLVYDVFTDLDPQFGEIFKTFLANGQIDVEPKKGKRGGAFCAHFGIAHPTYVMLNHTDKLRDVMTIAHEMGHAINNELIRGKQNALNFGTPMATAEVASTFMEDFVVERLLKEADDEMELSLRIRQLDDSIATIFRQIAFYQFEQELHAKHREQGYISSKEIGEIFSTIMAKQLGPIFGDLKDAANWWLYVPHFRSFFYVYSYASGLLISKAMQAKVRADKSFVVQTKTFLAAGLSKSPKDIFADMDIDITDTAFWHNGIDEIEHLLNDTEALAKKLGKA